MMPPSSDSDDLSVVVASGEESVGSRLGVATSRSNGSVVSMVVGSSESIVTDVAVSGSRASVLDLASDSDSDVGETASGGLPRLGQVLEVVSRGPPSTVSGVGGVHLEDFPDVPQAGRPQA